MPFLRSMAPEGQGGRPSKVLTLEQASAITKAAGIGENWTPRELRHSFVSILSDSGVGIEAIADLVGHRTRVVTQKVYRHQLRPVITTGATTMNTIFTGQPDTKSA
jgi:integrase